MPTEKVIKCCNCLNMKLGIIIMFILELLYTIIFIAVAVYNILAYDDMIKHKDEYHGVNK